MFTRSLKVAIAGIRSLTSDGRRPSPVRREPTSTPYRGDQSGRPAPELRKLTSTDQRTAQDLDLLLECNGVVS